MKITIRPAMRDDEPFANAGIDQLDYDVYWSVEHYCMMDEGIARSYRHALKLALRASRNMEQYRYIKKIEGCE